MDNNIKKRILVTGSLGLVGSEAVDFFTEKDWEVVGIDANMRSYFFGVPKGQPQYEIDIRNEKAIDDLFATHHFDAILHTAAQPSHDWSKKEPLTDFDINARGTLLLLEATRKYCPRAVFVHISTDKVYGSAMIRKDLKETDTRYESRLTFNENVSIDNSIHSLFGVSKTSADLYVQEYGRYFGMRTVCFRPGCITGRRHKGAEEHGFLAYLVKCIKEEKPYTVFGYNGKQVRDIIHAHDLVNAAWYFIQRPARGSIYNMGGGRKRSVSILEAVKMIEEVTGKKANLVFDPNPRKGDRVWDIHDVTRFRRHYPEWDYKYSLEDIIKDLCV